MTHELMAWIVVVYVLPLVRSLAKRTSAGSAVFARRTVLYLMYMGPVYRRPPTSSSTISSECWAARSFELHCSSIRRSIASSGWTTRHQCAWCSRQPTRSGYSASAVGVHTTVHSVSEVVVVRLGEVNE